MAAPMIVVEILMMDKMYANRKFNVLITGLAIGASLIFFFASDIRWGEGCTILKSMIPHHAGAVLMVEEGKLEDPEVKSRRRI